MIFKTDVRTVQLALSAILAVANSSTLVRGAGVQAASPQKPGAAAQQLSPEVQSQIEKNLATVAAIPPGGAVRGFVSPKAGTLEILLPKAKVFLKRADNNNPVFTKQRRNGRNRTFSHLPPTPWHVSGLCRRTGF